MTDNSNVIARIFYGNSKSLTYFVAGFIGSPIIGLLVIELFSLVGTLAEQSGTVVSPVVIMGVGTLACICFGWSYNVLISYGVWRFFQQNIHWIRYVLLALAITHFILVLHFTIGFVRFSIFSTTYLLEEGRFLFNM